jgi:hypothetical protein
MYTHMHKHTHTYAPGAGVCRLPTTAAPACCAAPLVRGDDADDDDGSDDDDDGNANDGDGMVMMTIMTSGRGTQTRSPGTPVEWPACLVPPVTTAEQQCNNTVITE